MLIADPGGTGLDGPPPPPPPAISAWLDDDTIESTRRCRRMECTDDRRDPGADVAVLTYERCVVADGCGA